MSKKNPSVLWTVDQGLEDSQKDKARDNIGVKLDSVVTDSEHSTLTFVDDIPLANGDFTVSKKKVTVDIAYNATSNNPASGTAVASAISTAINNTLNLNHTVADGKYLQAISVSNGVATFTDGTLDTAPSRDSGKAITSGAVYTKLLEKQNRPDNATSGNIATFNGNKDTVDSGKCFLGGNETWTGLDTDVPTALAVQNKINDSINDGTLSITVGSAQAQTFTANQSGDTSVSIPTGSGSSEGVLKLSASTTSTSGESGGYAATPSAVKAAYDLAASKQSPATTLSGYGITNAYTKTEVDGLLQDKANTSEMSVTPGTGADADKTTIQLKSGTSATVLTAHQTIPVKDVKVKLTTGGSFSIVNSSGTAIIDEATTTGVVGVSRLYNTISVGDINDIGGATPKAVSDFVTDYSSELIIIGGDDWHNYIANGRTDNTTFTKAQAILGRNHHPVVAVYNPQYRDVSQGSWGYHWFFPLEAIAAGCSLMFYSENEKGYYILTSGGSWSFSRDTSTDDLFIDYGTLHYIEDVRYNYENHGQLTSLRLPVTHYTQTILPLYRLNFDSNNNITGASWINVTSDAITTYSVNASSWSTTDVEWTNPVLYLIYNTSTYTFAEVLSAFNNGKILCLRVDDVSTASKLNLTDCAAKYVTNGAITAFEWTYVNSMCYQTDPVKIVKYTFNNNNTWSTTTKLMIADDGNDSNVIVQ